MRPPAGGCIDEYLVNGRHALQGLLADYFRVGGHFAPTHHVKSGSTQAPGQDLLAAFDQFLVWRKKYQAGGEVLGKLETAFLGDVTKKRLRKLQHDAATVAGLAVCCDCAPVRQACQRFQGGLNQPMALLTVHVSQKGETAAVSEIPDRVV